MTSLPTVFPSLPITFTGQSLVSHAGSKILADFTDALGFRHLCEDRLGQFVPSGASHRPGRLMGQLALMLAAGGEHVSDLDMFRAQPAVFGPVASNATVSRFFDRAADAPEVFTHGYETLSRAMRSRVWDACGERNPAMNATASDPLIIDLDATLVRSHSDKENAVGDYKGGYGFAPFIATADYGPAEGTGEILAAVLRPGNAGANSAKDHISVFNTAAAQLPETFFTDEGDLMGEKVLVRTDSAGASRKFLWYLNSVGTQFSVSYPVPAGKAHMVDWLHDKSNWEPALDADGEDRSDAWIINATDVIALTDYPPNTQLFLRAEPLHPGAVPTLLDIDGHRITAFLTNSPRWHGPYLDARHRARARCENRIKTLKNMGLGKLPFASFAANQAWANIAVLASNLISWLQQACLPTGNRVRFWDIKRFRYRLFSIAGKLSRHGRQSRLLLSETTPEKTVITDLLISIKALARRFRQSVPALI